jgi:PilZ domain
MNNRRRRTRVPFQTQVKFIIQGKALVSSDSKDLSLTGVYFFTDRRPEEGTSGEMEITLGLGTQPLTLRFKGVVARLDETGIGVRFLEMDPTSFVHLKNLLYYNTGNPEAIDAEIIHYPFEPESG